MDRTPIEVEAAKANVSDYKYLYLRELSKLYLGEYKSDIDWDAVIEARFFDDKSELRFFRDSGELKAALIEDGDSTDYRDKTSALEHKTTFGSELTVREYFDYDDDGQIYVTASRLVDWRA